MITYWADGDEVTKIRVDNPLSDKPMMIDDPCLETLLTIVSDWFNRSGKPTANDDLCGSPNRDKFKQNHKIHVSDTFYACDADLFLLMKPDGVIALIDYRTHEDRQRNLSFSDVLCYQSLTDKGIPVYIVSGDCDVGSFTLTLFIKGDYDGPPAYELETVATTKNWKEYQKWEAGIRSQSRAKR